MEKTRMLRFFAGAVIVTAVMLLYVHQNISIVEAGYAIRDSQKQLSNYLDEHRRLVYNLNKLESPSVLSMKLAGEKIQLVQANAQRIYYSKTTKKAPVMFAKAVPAKKVSYNVFDNLTLKAEARGRR